MPGGNDNGQTKQDLLDEVDDLQQENEHAALHLALADQMAHHALRHDGGDGEADPDIAAAARRKDLRIGLRRLDG